MFINWLKKLSQPQTQPRITITIKFENGKFHASFKDNVTSGPLGSGTKEEVSHKVFLFELNSTGPFEIHFPPEWETA